MGAILTQNVFSRSCYHSRPHRAHPLPPRSEYDVPYYMRASIDLNIRVGNWYRCDAAPGEVKLRSGHAPYRAC